jgi:predicted glycosyltransferase
MRVIIDVLTPKQVMFFPKLEEWLEDKGHEVMLTTRRYREVSQLIEKKGIEAVTVGEHGGGNLKDKLLAGTDRIKRLVGIFDDFSPDAAVSFSSPEMARTSYGLGVPHVCVNDSPHSVAVANLTIPLSERLLSPDMIPMQEWMKFGIAEENVVQYHALDPWVWVRDFEPDRGVLDELGLDVSAPIVTLRVPEVFASYLLGISGAHMVLREFIERFLQLRRDAQMVVVPRYLEQVKELKAMFGDRIALCESVVDGPSLIALSDVFVGMGGTMSAEAALLGVPTISHYPERYMIEDYLIKEGLISKELDPERLLKRIADVLAEVAERKRMAKEKAGKLVSGFEDPIEVIGSEVEKILEGS